MTEVESSSLEPEGLSAADGGDSPTRGPSFGPTALATPANALSVARILATPVVILLIVGGGHAVATFVIWAVLASTDWMDGWVARKQGTTRSGAFLDPLADKFLVLGAMGALASQHIFSWIPFGIIAFRELGISAYRSWVGRKGVSMPASVLAKVKTLFQDMAITLALIVPIVTHHKVVITSVLWVAVGLTVITGIQYWIQVHRLEARPPAHGGGSGLGGPDGILSSERPAGDQLPGGGPDRA